jgi:hypothetical protein
MQQAAAAGILDPPAYQTFDDPSSNTKMLLLALALFAVLGRLMLPVLVRGMRRVRAAMHAIAARAHAGCVFLARALRDGATYLAAKITALVVPPRMRVRYALAVPG